MKLKNNCVEKGNLYIMLYILSHMHSLVSDLEFYLYLS